MLNTRQPISQRHTETRELKGFERQQDKKKNNKALMKHATEIEIEADVPAEGLESFL